MRNLVIAAILVFISIPAFAVDAAPRISDREIIEGLADIRGDIKELKAEIKRLDEGQKGLRSEMNSRFESLDKRFDMLMWMIGLFVTISMVILGFVLRMQWQMMKRQAQMETALETQKDEITFLKGIIEKLLPTQGTPARY
ncbi:MAG: hypothetical protein HY786_02990 [Deltaproteobacteria bacterium]|nr:hypothetical protein [Deltaproteobacteria bacterium]